jgi:SAM-dependent methyltransferase
VEAAPVVVHWSENGAQRTARWRSERGAAPPKTVRVVDDRLTADEACGLAAQGIGLLWRGDFPNARQLLNAMAKRVDRKRKHSNDFNLERQARAQRARTLGMLLVPLEADYTLPLKRAPDLRVAFHETHGPGLEASVIALRELLGIVGAHEWRRKGIEVPAAGGRIHPHYGVFAPIRSEYIDLVATAPLPPALASKPVAFDIGTGTGVLAAVLARRGIARVVATDQDARALACARENVQRLGLGAKVEVIEADLFPEGRAALAVCNPPWVPARPSSPLEHGIYDPESRMLLGFLHGLAAHLEPGGEGWLLLSDLAEHLGLRSRDTLLAAFASADLKVIERLDARPKHPKASDATDPLHSARSAEVTSLWRLALT